MFIRFNRVQHNRDRTYDPINNLRNVCTSCPTWINNRHALEGAQFGLFCLFFHHFLISMVFDTITVNQSTRYCINGAINFQMPTTENYKLYTWSTAYYQLTSELTSRMLTCSFIIYCIVLLLLNSCFYSRLAYPRVFTPGQVFSIDRCC